MLSPAERYRRARPKQKAHHRSKLTSLVHTSQPCGRGAPAVSLRASALLPWGSLYCPPDQRRTSLRPHQRIMGPTAVAGLLFMISVVAVASLVCRRFRINNQTHVITKLHRSESHEPLVHKANLPPPLSPRRGSFFFPIDSQSPKVTKAHDVVARFPWNPRCCRALLSPDPRHDFLQRLSARQLRPSRNMDSTGRFHGVPRPHRALRHDRQTLISKRLTAIRHSRL